ncbi:MAG TPA: phosphoserine phosphatase SerB [Bdellovibrionota bacterium]|jgi:phosphoserine phosphatase
MNQHLLLKVSGVDAPGITAAIANCIEKENGKLLDIEQAATQGLLSLMVLVDVDSAKSTQYESKIREALKPYKLDIQFDRIDAKPVVADPTDRFVATVIAQEIPAKLLAELTAKIAGDQMNIDSIRKLSASGLSTIELICSSKTKVNLAQITEKLLAISTRFPQVDIAIQKENLYRRSKRLVVFDMDSTLIQGEVIDELADLLGKKAEVSALTKKAMEGDMDFQESLLRRVSLLKGLTRKDLDFVYSHIQMSPGAGRLIKALKRLGYRIAIISGGFTYFVERLKNELGVHYAYANALELEDETVTGRLQGLIVDGRRKADLLELLAQQEGVLLDQVIAIGDGANDLQMLKKAGLGIAFNAKPLTKALVGTSITHKSMDSILYLLGITDRELDEMGIR